MRTPDRVIRNGMIGTECQVKLEVKIDESSLNEIMKSLMLSAEILECALPSLVLVSWQNCPALHGQD